MRASAAGDGPLGPRSAVLLALAGPCRLLERVAPDRSGRRHAKTRINEATDAGDERASRVVADEAVLVAKAMCSIMGVADPELIVLGGGIGQAKGFLDAVEREVRRHAPIPPELRVSALGADAVVDGCLAAGIDRAWGELTATVAPAAADASGESAAGLR